MKGIFGTVFSLFFLLYLASGLGGCMTYDIPSDWDSISGNSYELRITHRLKESAPINFPDDDLDDSYFEPISDGKLYQVVFTEDGIGVGISSPDGEYIDGELNKQTKYEIEFRLDLFAEGRFLVWIRGVTLHAELTIFGSGVPIISGERGLLTPLQ